MRQQSCFRRLAAVLACLMFCALWISGAALAAGYRQLTAEELARECGITLHYTTINTENPTPLPATEFRLYKVADVNRDIQFTVTEAFREYPVFTPAADGFVQINELDAEGWASLAATLAGYVNRDSEKLSPAAAVRTDAQGVGRFSDLGAGLYLMLGDPSTSGATTYTPTPVLVALPFWNAETSDWEFQVSSNVKYTERASSEEDNTIQRRVLKVWEDEGNESARPSEVVVELLRNGEVYDTASLSAANNWRMTWEGLDANDQWQLTERVDSEDYLISITQQGVTFVVTNTYLEEFDDDDPPRSRGPEDPEEEDPGIDIDDPDVPRDSLELDDPEDDPEIDMDDPDIPRDRLDLPDDPDDIELDDPDVPLSGGGKLPQTGQLWWPVPLLAIAGAGMVLAGVIRRRGADTHEK